MSGSRRRVGLLAGLFGLGLLGVVGHLFVVMVVQHDVWLHRSYKNRWAFRDVPTRRGSLRDRNGMLVAEDVPCSALSLHYWTFRRDHPVGAAVEGANLALRAGVVSLPERHQLGYQDAMLAFQVLMHLPVVRLRRSASRERAFVARDLQFYISSLLSALSNGSHYRIRLRLRQAATAATGSRRPVHEVLGLELRPLIDLYRERLGELWELRSRLREMLAARYGTDDPARDTKLRRRDLLALLDRRRRVRGWWVTYHLKNSPQRQALDAEWREHLEKRKEEEEKARVAAAARKALPAWKRRVAEASATGQKAKPGRPEPSQAVSSGPEWPAPPRPDMALYDIDDQLPYELAIFMGRIQERHPGLVVHPSVQRRRGRLPGRDDLGSLEPLLGRVVRAFRRDDQKQRDQQRQREQLDRIASSLDELPDGDPELSDQLRQRVRERARKAVKQHLHRRGRAGTSGVERDLDPILQGNPGLRFVERSRRESERRLWSAFDMAQGADLQLSFDLRLQAILEQAMDEGMAHLPVGQVAAMAVVDPASGDVLALASRPAGGGLPAAVMWRSAGDVGSVVKPLIMLEHLDALRRGRPHADHTEFKACQGIWTRQLRCDHSHGPRARDPVAAIGESCNVFFYQAAKGLGVNAVLDGYGRFGLRQAGGNPMFAGRYQTHLLGLTLQHRVKRQPRIVEQYAIGYGIEANVLHMARAYAGLATGRLPPLTFVRGQPGTAPKDLGLHDDDLRIVRDGMARCVEQGTAKDHTLLQEFGVLAKTGTATVGPSRESKINNAWLAGYLTRERPTLAFAAVVYKVEGYGAEISAPLVTLFLQKLRQDPRLHEAYL